MHGGLLIDFVGQKSPVERWRLIGLDLSVLVLQVLVLGATLERRAIGRDSGRLGNVEEVAEVQRQDHDSEERGVLRQIGRGSSVVEDIEMQDLYGFPSQSDSNTDRERDNLLRHPSGAESRAQHPLDAYYTGEFILANLHLLDTIRTQWHTSGVSAEGANGSTSGVQAAVVAAAAGRTFTYRLNQGMQNSE